MEYFGIPIIVGLVVFGLGAIYLLRDRISGFTISKVGFQLHTNDVPVWNGVVDKIIRIDSSTTRSMRKQTVRMKILDPEKYGMKVEVLLANKEANEPLLQAVYENHHTRALVAGDGNLYVEDKAKDVFLSVRAYRSYFPELTEELAHDYMCSWMKNVLLPSVRLACNEKIAFYQRQLKRSDISKSIKEIIQDCLDKNMSYVSIIDKLSKRQDIENSSTIITPDTGAR